MRMRLDKLYTRKRVKKYKKMWVLLHSQMDFLHVYRGVGKGIYYLLIKVEGLSDETLWVV